MKAGSSVAAGVVLVVQEYAAHCSKMDKFVQKLYYAPFWDPKLGYIFWIFFALFFDQVLDHYLKFDFGLFWTAFLDLFGFLYIFSQKTTKVSI